MDTAGDGALAVFDSPARAVACAEAVRDGVRAGVYADEMEHGPGGEVQGIAVGAAGPHPVTPALVTGVATWLVLTARHDLAPREELKRETTGADRSP